MKTKEIATTPRIHIFEFVGGMVERLTDRDLAALGYDGPRDLHVVLVEEAGFKVIIIIPDTPTTSWYGKYA
ncbi:hypothetical protein KBB96_03590 [Luteolibacter ambystomatis]|uniref:Uncharacterized protein n=1 Tax=Luteolibacter ambystomatis TaxID=2824561 RepID=A0A975J0W1_9BACT|nr:hypothetical protein [Luteolibacter ambystomatis]QUE51976.1 hypothetical protein KBB96_03590 [Luteolibacter ambystomatis]